MNDEINHEIVDFWLRGAVADEVRRIAEADGRSISDVLKTLIESGIRRDNVVRRRVRQIISNAGGNPRA
jgi:hypothetical protein